MLVDKKLSHKINYDALREVNKEQREPVSAASSAPAAAPQQEPDAVARDTNPRKTRSSTAAAQQVRHCHGDGFELVYFFVAVLLRCSMLFNVVIHSLLCVLRQRELKQRQP
jgi:hypothetical protein